MRYLIVALSMLVLPAVAANAQVSVGISIGINVPVYPRLVVVPGYPVYYDPELDSNYFFYDGQYWVYSDDNWYTSDWYNGPWTLMEPEYVPLFILRVPVRYYRRPPVYFHGWSSDAAPHWGEHWGHNWEVHHRDWNHWDHHSTPRPAPLPVYQRQYSADRYPHGAEQRAIRDQQYHFKPHAPMPMQHQPELRRHVQPSAPSRATEQLHQQSQRQPERTMRPSSLPPPARNEQHVQPPHVQSSHPVPQRPSQQHPPLDNRMPPQKDHHEDRG